MQSPPSSPLRFAAGAAAALTLALGPASARPAGAEDPAGSIEVTVDGIRPGDGGDLVVALFNGESGWLDPDSSFILEAVPVLVDTARVVFEDVPYDSSYAVQVIHDRNRNGKFDMRWFPYPRPKEGGGVSNNHVRRGKPEYEKARFAVAESSVVLRIHMRY